MDLMYNMVERGANLFDAAAGILFVFLCMDLKDAYKKDRKIWLYTILFIVGLAFVQDKPKSFAVQFLVIVIFISIYAGIFLKQSFLEKLLYTILFLIVLMVASILVATTLSILTGENLRYVSIVGNIVRLYALVYNKIIVVVFSGLIILSKRKIKIDFKEWVIVFVFLLSIVGMSVATLEIAFYYDIDEKFAKYMFILVLGLILFSAISIVCVYRLNSQHRYTLENEVLKAKLKEEKLMLAKNQIMYEENSILRHDLKRYLTTVQGLLAGEDVAGAKKYIEESIGRHFDRTMIIYTNSSIVNVVLNEMKDKCEKNKIRCDLYVGGEISREIELDMGVMLSNLMENAYEAQLKEDIGNRYINIRLVKQKGMFTIRMKNYISKSILKVNPNLHTSKKDIAAHGFGIKSVRRMVEREGGTYSCYEEKNMFVTEIILPIMSKLA